MNNETKLAQLHAIILGIGKHVSREDPNWSIELEHAQQLLERCHEMEYRYKGCINQAKKYGWPLEKLHPGSGKSWQDVPNNERIDFDAWVYR